MDPKQKTGLAGLIFAVAALVTAIGSVLRPRDDTMTKASYEVLSENIRALQADVDRNREDFVWLRQAWGDELEDPPPIDAGAEADTPEAGMGPPVVPEPSAAPRPEPAVAHGTRKRPLSAPLPSFNELKQAAE